MQKEKVNIDGEKNAQINIAPKRFQHKDDTRLWLWSPKKFYITYIFSFFIFTTMTLLYYYAHYWNCF